MLWCSWTPGGGVHALGTGDFVSSTQEDIRRMKPKRMKRLTPYQTVAHPLTALKGVGARRAAFFREKGIQTILDLLYFAPIRYEDRTRFTPMGLLEEGFSSLIKGAVVASGERRNRRTGKSMYEIVIQDTTGRTGLVWFHYHKAHLKALGKTGKEIMAYGRIQRAFAGGFQMVHPELRSAVKGGGLAPPGVHPVYSAVEGVPDGVVRSAIREALEKFGTEIRDPVPENVLEAAGLPRLLDTFRDVHSPEACENLHTLNMGNTPSQKRLVFDRFFLVLLALGYLRKAREIKGAPKCPAPVGFADILASMFPFELTPDQAAAIRDISRDLSRGRVMNRLVMGDVGCGKTAVAAAAMHLCARNNIQSALMAPTRLLAEQHFETLSSLAGALDLEPVLLTGDMKDRLRKEVYEKIRSGKANPVIGTHSLYSQGPHFQRLGLVIIDEQQRFGVRDRARVIEKGENPHLLVMSATPIPRTLAMTLYGDLDISLIRQMPEGRIPVSTRTVAEGGKQELADSLARRMAGGQQAVVVCPSVMSSEDLGLKSVEEMTQGLRRYYSPRFRVDRVHGGLPAEERAGIMEDFRKGKVDLLVATTVIEVGVHVPNATVMVIEHPERFGLSQLHQLRGRVGRGTGQGVCYLVLPPGLSERAMERVRALERTADGFEIAELDLALRGAGELTGLRQAGLGELDRKEILEHPDLLHKARDAARDILNKDPTLEEPAHENMRAMVEALMEKGENR